MPITNKIKFINQEKISKTTTNSDEWVYQGTMMNGGEMVANHDYLMIAWVNCTSPNNNEGGTKFSFKGGAGDIVGSVQQRHDTNNSGMYVGHIGQFTAPDPPEDIAVYRKRLFGTELESTDLGQCFLIDLSYSGASGGLVSGIDYSSNTDVSTRSVASNNIFQTHTVNNASGTNLILAIAKTYDNPQTLEGTLIGLVANKTCGGAGSDELLASGRKFTQDTQDIKSILFAVADDIPSGTCIKLKNLDVDTIATDYSYIFTLNLDTTPATSQSGQLTTWTDHTSSGSWGTKTIDGNTDPSFIITMGRQTANGAQSGRMASVSLKNNTSNKWMLFENRVSGVGDFDPMYFPATNVGQDVQQFETSVIVGVGDIGDSDEIEMVTL